MSWPPQTSFHCCSLCAVSQRHREAKSLSGGAQRGRGAALGWLRARTPGRHPWASFQALVSWGHQSFFLNHSGHWVSFTPHFIFGTKKDDLFNRKPLLRKSERLCNYFWKQRVETVGNK